ncbi:MAG: EamA family transporter, partial [Methanimicrococcus sp.]|nr:EamA family transporter [Methanimicrococcus sp.]
SDAVEKCGKKPDRKWLIFAFLSALFAALTSILGKIGIEDVNSNLGTAVRTIVVLIMAWLIVFYLGKQKEIQNIDMKSWIFIILSGLATGLSWLFFFGALKGGLAAVVVPIDKLSVLVTVVFAYVFLKEKVEIKSWFGLLLITAGTLLLLVQF